VNGPFTLRGLLWWTRSGVRRPNGTVEHHASTLTHAEACKSKNKQGWRSISLPRKRGAGDLITPQRSENFQNENYRFIDAAMRRSPGNIATFLLLSNWLVTHDAVMSPGGIKLTWEASLFVSAAAWFVGLY